MVIRIICNVFFLIFIGLLIYIIKKKVTKTGYIEIYSLLWVVLIIGSQFAGPLYFVQISTLFTFYIAWIFFLLPSLVLYANKNLIDKAILEELLPNKNRLKIILFLLMFVSIAVNIATVYGLSGDVNFFKFGLIALRLQGRKLLDEQSTIVYQLFAKCYVIYIPLAMIGYKNRFITKFTLVGCCLVGLFTCVVTLTRAPILFWAITIITSCTICFTITQKKFYIYIFFLITPVIITTLLFGMENSELLEMIKLYLFGGVKAYEVILNNQYSDMSFYDSKVYSIDFLNYILKRNGFIEQYPSLVREYTYNPQTNVYTYLDAATLDLGLAGAILSASVLGTLAAFVHFKANSTNTILYVSYYCFINYAIAISFMNNELIRINGFILLAELLIIHSLIKPVSPNVPNNNSSLITL